jgi:hypothetical protein
MISSLGHYLNKTLLASLPSSLKTTDPVFVLSRELSRQEFGLRVKIWRRNS